ncbi:MAG: GMC family oxidoreductase [Defluviicoccus sp.]|nr:GMC family oxidoreductase [Defluviicoccus sp.]
MDDDFDAIIVGSGAGGGAAAYRLATSGCRVLVLEKGAPLPHDGSTLDAGIVLREGRFKNHAPWRDGDGAPFVPQEYYNLGGKTKWYGAALLRFGSHEFADDPAHQCRGWPFAYDALAPYYEQAEELLGVRRFAVEPDTQRIAAAFERVAHGWQVEPMPLGLAADILEHPEEAVRFDGFASPRGLKSDAEVRLLDPLRNRPGIRIETNAEVVDLITAEGAPERVTGVITADGSRFTAKMVLLAAGALSSPRLLQHHLHATGLDTVLPAAQSVGRNYKSHLLTAVVGWSPRRKTDRLRKTVVMTSEAFAHSSVQPLGATDGEIVATELPAFMPRWVADLVGNRAYGFFLQTEDGSHPDNRVSAANGFASPQLDYDRDRIGPARDEHRHFVRAFCRDLLRVGMFPIVKPIPLSGTAHACGTLIAGNDPATSVVDAFGKVHGMDGLYVVDGSVLPRSSRVNPALTIYAWALRVADSLAPQLASHSGENR